jgi:hypothetical protein
MKNYFGMGITYESAKNRLETAVIIDGEVVGSRPCQNDEDCDRVREVAIGINNCVRAGALVDYQFCPECGTAMNGYSGHTGCCALETKIRRRVEDALRKTATPAQVWDIATLLGVKTE